MKVAVVQAGSVPFDSWGATQKACALIAECGENGATTAVFPEAFIGSYPKGSTFGSSMAVRTEAGRDEYAKYASAAVTLDSPEIQELITASANAGVFVVMGIIERLGNTLYCTAIMIDPQEGLVGKHRKLMPTAMEKLAWGFGDGSTLDVVDSPAGKLGTVICWENYMPLLRQAMYAQGVEIYCAPTADDRDTWAPSMIHVAREGRVFVLSACQAVKTAAYPDDHPIPDNYQNEEYLIRGGSMIVDPLGNVLAGPVFNEETILYADIDMHQKSRSHIDFDTVGHYSRSDIFTLQVNTAARESVVFV